MHNNKEMTLSAPLSGPVIALADIPDPVFSSGTMGGGLAIDPLDDCLHAPCAGVVVNVARTGHAITLRADNGAEWLMHIGIDSVTLNGDGFKALVAAGQRVAEGQPLVRFDLDKVAVHSRSLISALILLNGEGFELTPVQPMNTVNVGEPLLRVTRLAHADANDPTDRALTQSSRGVIRVGHHGGLHARPAALVRQTARQFASQTELHFAGARASSDSVLAIMGLGVAEHDEVEVICLGHDSEVALQALLKALSTPTADEKPYTPTTSPLLPPATSNGIKTDVLTGITASPGLACGPLFRLDVIELEDDPGNHTASEQRQALDGALDQVRTHIAVMLEQSRPTLDPQAAAIFATHLAMLDDPALLDAAYGAIEEGRSASHAWSQALMAQCARLQALDNALLAERANDLRDLRQRVLRQLLGADRPLVISPHAIVIAQELTPSDLMLLSEHHIAGVCVAEGGATSHVAILARAKGLPCVVAVGGSLLTSTHALAGQTVVLDADNAQLELMPDPARLQQVASLQARRIERRHHHQQQSRLPATTLDGVTMDIAANVASDSEARRALEAGADGVGLLRTEFLFLERRTAPSEDEQLTAYQAVLDAMEDKPVIIRTLDIGGDKQLDYLPLPPEANPVLGLRGIRLGQARPELLDQQLRALLQVTPSSRCRILLPMITEVGELIAVRQRLDALASQLGICARPQLGVMIEVPSAALMAGHLAEHADFLSIGTNDLSQYTLAMDRDHAGLAGRVDALHPALLRLIAMTCAATTGKPCWVGVCGAVASDPLATAALIGLGVRELSVSSPQLAEIKALVRQLDTGDCERLAQRLLTLRSAPEVRQACSEFARQSLARQRNFSQQ
jgi:phosphoenolpyruvate-protein phosphotransferase